MSLANLNAKTFANIQTDTSNAAAGIAFSKLLHYHANSADIFSRFEGADGQMGFPVCRKTELQTFAGQSVRFTTIGELGGRGILGENTLRGNEEKPRYGNYSVYVDFVRHATSWTRKSIGMLPVGSNIPGHLTKLLGEWKGRRRQSDALARLRINGVKGYNVLFPQNKASINKLRTASTFSTTVIEAAASLAAQRGAMPIRQTKTRSGAPIQNYMFFGPEQVMRPILSDSSYTAALQNAQVRGYGNNELFDGGVAQWNGHTVFHWYSVDPDVDGPIGSIFDPRATLGGSIATGTGQVTIYGGANTSGVNYFEFFPGFSRKQYDEETGASLTGATNSVAYASNDYFLIIYNITGSDAGKWGFYRFTGTGNTGTQIVSKNENGNASTGAGGRLGSSTSGTASTKIGDVAAGTGNHVVWSSTVNTDDHPVGSLIFLANQGGVPYGFIGCLGSNALLRAYGGGAMGASNLNTAGKVEYEDEDYGMVRGAGVEMVYGTDVAKDTQGYPRNYVLIPAAYAPNGISLPTVTD